MKVVGFDWDDGNRSKCEGHGLSSDEIEAFFQSPIWVAPDLKHSDSEERYIAIGRADGGRPIFVAFTLRLIEGEVVLRPISARFMHDKEAKRYEEAFAKDEIAAAECDPRRLSRYNVR